MLNGGHYVFRKRDVLRPKVDTKNREGLSEEPKYETSFANRKTNF